MYEWSLNECVGSDCVPSACPSKAATPEREGGREGGGERSYYCTAKIEASH
jgi:hypothetical protein